MKKSIKNTALMLLLVAALACTATACDGNTPADTGNETDASTVATNGDTAAPGGDASAPAGDTEASGSTTTPITQAITLVFNGVSCNVSDTSAVSAEAGAFVITKGGTYELSGDLSNGQVRVAVPKTEEVTLILNNFTASSATTAPLYIDSCDKVTIELAAGTVNSLTDASVYQYASPTEDKPNACLYSSDDMTIKGSGTLNVTGNYNNGIGCKNDLRIKSGTINVTAPNNLLKGNDSVTVEGGKLTLSGGEDAIKSDTTDRTDKGFVLISGNAEITINCLDDALQATMSITVEAGASVTITAGGDATNCPGTVNCAEGTLNIISQNTAA